MREIDLEKLYEIAGDNALLLEQELWAFLDLERANFELKCFLEDTGVPEGKRKMVLREVVPDASAVFYDLAGLLIDEDMMRKLHMLAEDYTETVSKKTRTPFAKVACAYLLSKQEMNEIKEYCGKSTRVYFFADPELISGIRILWEDGRFFDASIAGAFQRLKEEVLV